MALLSFILGLALTTSVTACPGHTNHQVKAKRADFTVPESNVTVPSPAEWAYDESYDWGMLSPGEFPTSLVSNYFMSPLKIFKYRCILLLQHD